MTETDTKEVEFNFGDISVGESLEPEQLEAKEPEEPTEETPEESPEETTEESSEESTEDSSEESNEEPNEDSTEDSTEESSEELSTEDILGDPLEEKEEKSDGRSYEGFDDEDKQYAKQMSNNAYEHFSKKLKELKTKKDAAEETQDLMSHPEAYTLNPEYQELVTDYDKASQEQAHWKRQLVAIRNGDSWRSIEGYDKNGKLVLGKEEYKPTGESEIDVQSALTEAQTLSKSYSKRAHDIQKNHTKDYKESTDMLEEEQRKQFKWLQDKEMGKKVIDIPNLGKTSINKLRKTFGEAIPKVFTNHPMSELATNLWVMNQILAKQQHELTQKIKKQNTNKKDMLRGEPKATTSGVEDDDIISISDGMADYFS
tara:strand:- start:2451 stop:3563 length:1113 start_codon:yes stop_codon:yes gene_type:complete